MDFHTTFPLRNHNDQFPVPVRRPQPFAPLEADHKSHNGKEKGIPREKDIQLPTLHPFLSNDRNSLGSLEAENEFNE